jgi:hypothetical protein
MRMFGWKEAHEFDRKLYQMNFVRKCLIKSEELSFQYIG